MKASETKPGDMFSIDCHHFKRAYVRLSHYDDDKSQYIQAFCSDYELCKIEVSLDVSLVEREKKGGSMYKFKPLDKVIKVTGDYFYEGVVVSVFSKVVNVEHDLAPSGEVRYVVQNEDGLLHIFNESQLELIRTKESKT